MLFYAVLVLGAVACCHLAEVQACPACLLCAAVIFFCWKFDTFVRFPIQGKVALITGAGSGIGRLLAIEFARRGVSVLVLWDIRPDFLDDKDLVESIEHASAKAGVKDTCVLLRYIVDVSDSASVKEVASQVRRRLLGEAIRKQGIFYPFVSILVNNAGVVNGRRLLDPMLLESDIRRTFNVNLLSHFWTLRAFLPGMIEQTPKAGLLDTTKTASTKQPCCVVTVSSLMGMMSSTQLSDYCASKWALLGMHECLRLELSLSTPHVGEPPAPFALAQTHIHTMVVCPYVSNTGMFAGAFTGAGHGIAQNIIPSLSPEYVASEIAAGIEQKRHIMVIPRFLSLIPHLLQLLPVPLYNAVIRLGGGEKGMMNFVGRGKNWKRE